MISCADRGSFTTVLTNICVAGYTNNMDAGYVA